MNHWRHCGSRQVSKKPPDSIDRGSPLLDAAKAIADERKALWSERAFLLAENERLTKEKEHLRQHIAAQHLDLQKFNESHAKQYDALLSAIRRFVWAWKWRWVAPGRVEWGYADAEYDAAFNSLVKLAAPEVDR